MWWCLVEVRIQVPLVFLSSVFDWTVFYKPYEKWCSFHMIYFPAGTYGGFRSCVCLLPPVTKFSDFSNKNNKHYWMGSHLPFLQLLSWWLTAVWLVVAWTVCFPFSFCVCNWWDFIVEFLLFVCTLWLGS